MRKSFRPDLKAPEEIAIKIFFILQWRLYIFENLLTLFKAFASINFEELSEYFVEVFSVIDSNDGLNVTPQD
jgi:hypothetical protein